MLRLRNMRRRCTVDPLPRPRQEHEASSLSQRLLPESHRARSSARQGVKMETHAGKIKFYDGAKGYGFVRADEGDEFFYHITDWAGPVDTLPSPDLRVKFTVVTGKKGLKAGH